MDCEKGSKLLNKSNYQIKKWIDVFPNSEVSLRDLSIHRSWKKIFEGEMDKEYFSKLEKYLSKCLRVTNGAVKIYPYPNLVFSAFNVITLDQVKVVILGQDPYFRNEMSEDQVIPQAMGLSFSVPVGVKIPSSLDNIYKNMLKFDAIRKRPKHGNLMFWACQGCLMLNTSLTVQHGHKNSHSKYWTPFTDAVIKYISKKKEGIIFVLWGNPALSKLPLINQDKHKVIISSHPSGLSCHKKLKSYECFMDQDHFNIINQYLEEQGKNPIVWQL